MSVQVLLTWRYEFYYCELPAEETVRVRELLHRSSTSVLSINLLLSVCKDFTKVLRDNLSDLKYIVLNFKAFHSV